MTVAGLPPASLPVVGFAGSGVTHSGVMPPNWAMAMARAVSVTVSMAAETIGTLSEISRVRRVRISTSPGVTSDGPGSSSTSSNVMAWRMRIEGGCCSIDPSIDSPGSWEVGRNGIGAAAGLTAAAPVNQA